MHRLPRHPPTQGPPVFPAHSIAAIGAIPTLPEVRPHLPDRRVGPSEHLRVRLPDRETVPRIGFELGSAMGRAPAQQQDPDHCAAQRLHGVHGWWGSCAADAAWGSSVSQVRSPGFFRQRAAAGRAHSRRPRTAIHSGGQIREGYRVSARGHPVSTQALWRKFTGRHAGDGRL